MTSHELSEKSRFVSWIEVGGKSGRDRPYELYQRLSFSLEEHEQEEEEKQEEEIHLQPKHADNAYAN